MSDTQTTGYASLLPTDADVSGFLDGVEATIARVRAVMFDYNGTLATPVPAIEVQFHTDSEKQPNPQHYTVGKPDHRVPSEDGTRFKTFGAKKGLPKDSNGLKFIVSLVNGGFPADKIGDDLTVFENGVVLLRAEAQEKRDGDTKDRTVILVDKIVKLPWENKAPKKSVAPAKSTGAKPAAGGTKPATAGKPAASAPAAAPASGSPMEDEDAKMAATEALMTMLADEKIAKPIKKAQLGPLSFRILAQNPNRNAATKLLTQLASEFLPTIAEAGMIVYDAEAQTVSSPE